MVAGTLRSSPQHGTAVACQAPFWRSEIITARICRVPLRLRLVLAGALMLILELALIRRLGSNVLRLCYFNDIALHGQSPRVGLGFLRVWRSLREPWYHPIAPALLGPAVRPVPVTIDRCGSAPAPFPSRPARSWSDLC